MVIQLRRKTLSNKICSAKMLPMMKNWCTFNKNDVIFQGVLFLYYSFLNSLLALLKLPTKSGCFMVASWDIKHFIKRMDSFSAWYITWYSNLGFVLSVAYCIPESTSEWKLLKTSNWFGLATCYTFGNFCTRSFGTY